MIARMSHQSQNGDFQHLFSISPNQYSYNGPIPQLNFDITQQGVPTHRPRSSQTVRNSAPSPSLSVYTTRTAPNLRHSNRTQCYSTGLSPTGHGTHLETADDLSLTPEYLPRGYDGNERPWSLYNTRSSNPSGFRSPFGQSTGNYGQFRGPGSNVDSHVPPSDEGYGSQVTRSMLSNEPDCTNQDVPSIVLKRIDDMNVQAPTSEAPSMSRRPSDQRSQVSGRSGKSNKSMIQCLFPGCEEKSRCNSDHKYVLNALTVDTAKC
jgi:hypothetical protein